MGWHVDPSVLNEPIEFMRQLESIGWNGGDNFFGGMYIPHLCVAIRDFAEECKENTMNSALSVVVQWSCLAAKHVRHVTMHPA